MKEILKHFLTQDEDDKREFVNKFAVMGGFTYACDGKWVCRIKGEHDFGEKIKKYPVPVDLPWDKIAPPFFKISQTLNN